MCHLMGKVRGGRSKEKINKTRDNNMWKFNSALAGARGRGQCNHFSLLFMNRLNQTESAVSIFAVFSVFPKGQYYISYHLHNSRCCACVAAVKSLPALHSQCCYTSVLWDH